MTKRLLQINMGGWRSSLRIAACEAASKGVFAEILCLCKDMGTPEIVNTVEMIARLTRCSRGELVEALLNLKECGVLRVDTLDDGRVRIFNICLLGKINTNPRGWNSLRSRILRRDEYACRYCGDRATSVDHVIPRSRGGSHDPRNLVACCKSCNSRKNAKTPNEAGMTLCVGVN